MKKLFFTLAISLISFLGFSQSNLLTFKIDALAYSSDGSDIKTGAIFTFIPRNAFASVENIAMDVNCYTSESAKIKAEDIIWICTDKDNRIKTKIISVNMPIQSAKQICYSELLVWLQDYLENIYGSGNVIIVQ